MSELDVLFEALGELIKVLLVRFSEHEQEIKYLNEHIARQRERIHCYTHQVRRLQSKLADFGSSYDGEE